MKMKTNNPTQAERRWDAAALDELIDEFTVEAAGDDERVLAFLRALEKHVPLPCDGFVIGEPVLVEAARTDREVPPRGWMRVRGDGFRCGAPCEHARLALSGRVPEMDGS